MKSTLYSQFQECLEKKDTSCLEVFRDHGFWDELNSQDKEGLARLFLLHAEERLQQGEELEEEEGLLFDSLQCAEQLAPSHPEIYCREAFVLLRWGMIHQKGKHLLRALEKLITAESLDPAFFETFFEWSHLWGNILVALSHYVSEEGMLEKALAKFQKAEELLKKEKISPLKARELYWDWAEAWVRLGKLSEEAIDFQRAVEKFQEAAHLGCDLPHFRIDYGEALLYLGRIQGNPIVLRSALELFKEAVAITFPNDVLEPAPAAYKKGWRSLVLTAQKIAEMTGEEEDFRQADRICQEAILAIPSQADLWLQWGELYLTHGWLYKDVASLETALEKLTATKVSECDPTRVSTLLTEGLVLLGILVEDYKLLKEAEARIVETAKLTPDKASVYYCLGLSSFALGLYFSEDKYFAQAVEAFRKGLAKEPFSIKLWYGLFQAQMGWGMSKENEWILHKGVLSIARVVELSPFSPHYWCQWGVALLRVYQFEREEVSLLENAATKFTKAIELRSEKPEPDWLFYQACAYDLLGDYYGDESYYEKAALLLMQVLEKVPQAVNARFQLALTLSHLGEATGDVESLHQANDLFQSIIKPDEEDESAWCEWGYTLLLLSELVWDPLHPEEGRRLRSLAEAKLMHAVTLGSGPAHYHLACLYSLSLLFDAAMDSLRKAEAVDSLPPLEDLEHDEWLEGLRRTSSFQDFLNLRKKQSLS